MPPERVEFDRNDGEPEYRPLPNDGEPEYRLLPITVDGRDAPGDVFAGRAPKPVLGLRATPLPALLIELIRDDEPWLAILGLAEGRDIDTARGSAATRCDGTALAGTRARASVGLA